VISVVLHSGRALPLDLNLQIKHKILCVFYQVHRMLIAARWSPTLNSRQRGGRARRPHTGLFFPALGVRIVFDVQRRFDYRLPTATSQLHTLECV
jgi:hypothetical protein